MATSKASEKSLMLSVFPSPILQVVPNAINQQDDTRPRIARISSQALQDIQVLPWPPVFQDLSPIKHIWTVFSPRLRTVPPPHSKMSAANN
ncbi:hypothetical protein TNCV_2282201 [Trichonephila clavipes]|nr:hypothetical protein TNCV_2282201 [Trichonephila clavipes]